MNAEPHMLRIKNMVCSRCKSVVRSRLKTLGFTPLSVELGEAVLAKAPSQEDLKRISESLVKDGFELLDDKRRQLIEQIKIAAIEVAQNPELMPAHQNLSNYMRDKFGLHYTYLSNLFTETEGITLKQFFILQKMEKVKEWLTYDEMTLNQIADKLNYSTLQYLSKQFKKVTGMTPTEFKTMHRNARKPLEEIQND
jgi:AraC family transcriptional regulator